MFIDKKFFDESVKELVGLSISEAYNSIGSSLCMELGELTVDKRGREKGEFYIRYDWDWRLEDDKTIICGSSNAGPKIAHTAETLIGLEVVSLELYGSPPEVEISFSNGQRLRSMAMVSGYPQWTIRLKDGSYLSCGAEEDLSPKEEEWIEWSKATSERWGCPVLEPARGRCAECLYFERLDGNFYLLEFGVCSFAGGPFDGRVVNTKSGCPEYVDRTSC